MAKSVTVFAVAAADPDQQIQFWLTFLFPVKWKGLNKQTGLE